jgi:hypothetical protein
MKSCVPWKSLEKHYVFTESNRKFRFRHRTRKKLRQVVDSNQARKKMQRDLRTKYLLVHAM